MKRAHKILIATMVVAIVGGIAIISGTGLATNTSFSMDGDTQTFTDGKLHTVHVSASGQFSWDGADVAPKHTTATLQVKRDGNWHNVKRTTVNGNTNRLSGSVDYNFNNVDLLNNSPYRTHDFEADADGSTKKTNIPFRVVINTEENMDGNNVDRVVTDSDTATITVKNEKLRTGATGSGSVTID